MCLWVNIFPSHRPAKKMHVQLVRLLILLFTLQGFSHLCREKCASRWKAMLQVGETLGTNEHLLGNMESRVIL